MAEGISARLTRSEARRFGITVGAAFLLLGTSLWWRHRLTLAEITIGVGAALALAGLTVPMVLAPINRAWMAGALAVSKVTTPIFLGMVYFAVLTPIGLARRLFGRSPNRLNKVQDSFWIPREVGPRTPADMEHQY